jgi:hypothetical protein
MTTKFASIDNNRTDPMRKIGMGANPMAGAGQTSEGGKNVFIGWVKKALGTPNYTVPSIENVRIHYDGPLSDSAINQTFNASINPLTANQDNPPPMSVSVESTMAMPGQFQTPTLITAVGWHLTPEPLIFTAKGNGWTMPTSTVAAPVSPDAWDSQDNIGVNGPLGAASNSMVQAWLDWAAWQEIAFWHMVNAYNLVWQMGNRTFLMRESLRNTAWVPGNAQNGSSSSSEQDIYYYARIVNNYYRANFANNTPQIFLPLERTRIGNMILVANGTTTTGLSVFRPTRAYETVGATYGGMGLRGFLTNNQEFRRLTSPFLMKPGVPIGLRADVAISASSDQVQMQNWLSATDGFTGAIPPNFSVDTNINPSIGVAAGGAIGMEPSLDATVAAEPITTLQNRSNFKGGSWKIGVVLKGFELTDQQASMLSDPSVQAQLTQLGCGSPQSSGGGYFAS